MDKFVKLGQDMVLLWSKYKVMYWAGIWNTLKLAFLATLIGCFIGLLCGVLNTIPYTKKDPLPKRFLLKLLRIIIRIYVEVFRGTPMVLQSVFIYYGLPYFSNNALRFDNIFAAALLIVYKANLACAVLGIAPCRYCLKIRGRAARKLRKLAAYAYCTGLQKHFFCRLNNLFKRQIKHRGYIPLIIVHNKGYRPTVNRKAYGVKVFVKHRV